MITSIKIKLNNSPGRAVLVRWHQF